jgi:hypothetical protein
MVFAMVEEEKQKAEHMRIAALDEGLKIGQSSGLQNGMG